MAASFDQLLGSNNSKTAGTSLTISPSSKTVTVGRTIFVAYAGDDVGSAFGITDNLGNTYTQVKEQINAGNVKTQLWAAPVTVGGSITSITIAWTTNVTAKAAVAGEFSSFGSQRLTDGANASNTLTTAINSSSFFNGELWVGALGVEDDVAAVAEGAGTGIPNQTAHDAGSDGTTGGGSASNISVTLSYILIGADSVSPGALVGSNSGSQDSAGAGAIYNNAAASKAFPFTGLARRHHKGLIVR